MEGCMNKQCYVWMLAGLFFCSTLLLAQPLARPAKAGTPDMKKLGAVAREFYEQKIAPSGKGSKLAPQAMNRKFFTGQAAGDNFGYSIASAGDVNGDGYSDIIIGALNNDAGGSNAGRAYIFFGGPAMSTTPDVILTGEASMDLFGTSVAGAGDFNGDGYDDVIVGAYQHGGSHQGRAYIYLGGPKMNNVADVVMTGSNANDYFGISVARAGDVNGDGYSDVIVGAYNYSSGTGIAYIFYGGTGLDNHADVVLTGEAAGNYFGFSVAGAGDVNGDGYSDVIVGAFQNGRGGSNAGSAYIYFGGASMDNSADLILSGTAAEDNFGISVGGAGDVNDDGYSDVIVGAPNNDVGGSDAGIAYIFFGGYNMQPYAGISFTGVSAGDHFGRSVAGAGDVNGDGYCDVIVGAPDNQSNGAGAGRAYIYFGGAAMDNIADAVLTGDAAGDALGISVACAGDVNGDGYGDVIVGAHLNDAGGTNAGRVYLYLNSLSGSDIADEFFTGYAAGDELGYSVANAGDVNGDGYPDVIVGAPQYNSGQGRAYIFFGGPGMNNTADVVLTGATSHIYFGTSVASAGDVNGDGYSDVIVGAPSSGGSGQAIIFFGGASMDNTPDVTLSGEAASNDFGHSVAGAGDVNGDGYSDVIVGALYNSANGSHAGRAYIFLGGPGMDNTADLILTGKAAGDEFGGSVAGAGDVNGDGYSDVIVGAIGSDVGGSAAGQAYIFFGGASMDTTADVVFTGEAAGDFFGNAVACAGDVNGDGYSDVIVGAYYSDANGVESGRAYVFFGGAVMDNMADVALTGEAPGDHFGTSVACAGDVNGDGYSDVVVGARDNDAGGVDAGRAYILFGGPGMDNTADIILTGEAPNNAFGISVACAGDVNGDGCSDVIVGAHGNGAGGTNAGRAYLYLSTPPPVKPRIAAVRDVPNDQGGQVTVNWIHSGYDARGIAKITEYVVQRSLPPGTSGFAWQNVATMTATQEPRYSYIASTPSDSITSSSGTVYFHVVARTSNSLESWKSNILAGHSVDNLAPLSPAGAQLLPLVDGPIKIHWNPDKTDPDVGHFSVYRSTSSGFLLNDGTRLKTTIDTTVTDSTTEIGQQYYYKVTTVDIHGNESQPTAELGGTALPIQLASLTATTLTTGVQLEWITLSEVNSQGFYVERRPKNSGAYTTVSDLIPGAGTSLEEHHYQWTDTKVTDGNYNYRLKLVDLNGDHTYSKAITVAVSGVLGVDDPKLLPTEFALRQNYPNPFNPTTVINYQLPAASYVTLTVYNMLGQEVATLVSRMQEAGYKSVEFDASKMPSGLYLYKLTAGMYTSVQKMVL